MKLEDVGKLCVADLLVHENPEVRRLAQEIVKLLLKKEKKA